jgi:signal peptidase
MVGTGTQAQNKEINSTIDEEPIDKNNSDKKTKLINDIKSTLKEILVALIIIGIIIVILVAYTNFWPPIMVIESNSMMHDEDSSIGTLDVGDIVLIKSISNRNDIKTYVTGSRTGYKNYNSYGDVIFFNKNGLGSTPVIHRPIVWIEYNSSGKNNIKGYEDMGSFDVPELELYDTMVIRIPNYELRPKNLTVNLNHILKNFKSDNIKPHGGFITKGDNNDMIDQSSLRDSEGRLVRPIKMDWVIGKAEGEIPWLGLINMYLTGGFSKTGQEPPPNSVNMLILTVIIIIIIIVIIHIFFIKRERIKRRKFEEKVEKKEGMREYTEKVGENGHETKSKSGFLKIFSLDHYRQKRKVYQKKKTMFSGRRYNIFARYRSSRNLYKYESMDHEKQKPTAPIAKSVETSNIPYLYTSNNVPIAKPIREREKTDEYLGNNKDN